MNPPLRLVVLFSGGGRTALNLVDEIERGSLHAVMVGAICSRQEAPGIGRLRARGIPVRTASAREYPDPKSRDDAVERFVDAWAPDLIALCGYLRLLRIKAPWHGRVINIHPSLLPRHGGRGMHGDHVHASVLAAGEAESGCTVHWVDDVYDRGEIILQRRCPVRPGDDVPTLAARVFAEECLAYPEAIRRISRSLGDSGPAPRCAVS